MLNTNDKNIDETPSKMLEASLLEEPNNLSDQKEILSDEEEIYSGTHNAGNGIKTVDASLSNEILVSAENHDRRDSSASAHSDSASLSENNPKPINPDTVSESVRRVFSLDG